jgi:hypothetical protein
VALFALAIGLELIPGWNAEAQDIENRPEQPLKPTAAFSGERSPSSDPLINRAVSELPPPLPSKEGETGGRFAGKIERYARRLMKRYDLSGDGLLDQSEWLAMRGDPAGTMDQDRNGVITSVEIEHRVGNFGKRSLRVVPARSTESTTGQVGSGNESQAAQHELPDGTAGRRAPATADTAAEASPNTPTARMMRRFFVSASQLPMGVAGWFLDDDFNGDGQVTMAEFSANWTDVEAERFATWDLNRDGVITAAECASAESKRLAAEAAQAAEEERRGQSRKATERDKIPAAGTEK